MDEEYDNDNYDDIEIDDSEDFTDGIEIEDGDDDDDDQMNVALNTEGDDASLSKHTANEKHSLVHDSIFKGKKEKPLDEFSLEGMHMYFNDTFEVDKSSNYWTESIDNENYVRNKLVREKIYEVLDTQTELNFSMNRRKPSKADFNNYFYLIKSALREESFTNIELFNELSVYFSDNLFNMFKLLDDKWRKLVINELEEHIGKQAYSKDILNRNIYMDTEIEFVILDIDSVERHITGVIIATHYDDSSFTVDSYENVYHVELGAITKILNNTKFKTNLDKLNNIDFL
jgi:hypothetical protein